MPFERGDVVVTTRDDYISNQIMLMSLQKRFGIELVHAPDVPEGGVDADALRTLLGARRPRLVAVTHVPTNSGLVQPVEAIGAICRELDLLYLVDACQSVGQRVVDVEAIGCDFSQRDVQEVPARREGQRIPLRLGRRPGRGVRAPLPRHARRAVVGGA